MSLVCFAILVLCSLVSFALSLVLNLSIFPTLSLGLLALTVGFGDNAREILEDSVPMLTQALKSGSESSKIRVGNHAVHLFINCFYIS